MKNREANKLKSISPQIIAKPNPLEEPFIDDKVLEGKMPVDPKGMNKEIIEIEGFLFFSKRKKK